MQAYGDCPPGLLRCLGRLGAEPRGPETYRALVSILQRGGPSAKALVHSAELAPEFIHAFASLPAGMASQRTIGLVVRGHISPGDLATFSPKLRSAIARSTPAASSCRETRAKAGE